MRYGARTVGRCGNSGGLGKPHRAGLGLPGLLVHDLRRSAAKALRKAGVPESVIMATGGWKTASMFRRYAIVSSADQRDAMEKLELDRAKDQAKNSPVLSPFIHSHFTALSRRAALRLFR